MLKTLKNAVDRGNDAPPSRLPRGLRLAAFGAGGLLLLWMLAPFAVVPSGHRGVLLSFGKAGEEALGEGLNFRIPIMQSVYAMPVMIERSETESEAASKDLQRVTTTVVLNFHVDPKQVVTVYRSLGMFPNIEPRIIDPSVQEAMKAVTARYTAEQLVTRREDVAQAIRGEVAERIARHGIVVDEFSITNFKFSDAFDAAIEAKTVAEQQKLKAERDLERIKVEAEQTIAQARATAESQRLTAEAEAEGLRLRRKAEADSALLAAQAQAEGLRLQRESVTPQLIELRRVEAQMRAIEKWDGVMPRVTAGATPFLSVDGDASP
ncbi:SPFH domain-containing protein [Silanimonas sp.]|jgi:regulator of protease activity HflC (stomatin/prohibitin superfamily)|uniref:SPFH domain-containing protein n=1 Tax=Silanimonas sp. TaxID=1929290 RepID=UPI0022CA3B67|nr:SPFH domain-containing protein [Silanimonas sp.]MCZ8115634.1 SPFH domain-containing protein [Silanimonas sp.]